MNNEIQPIGDTALLLLLNNLSRGLNVAGQNLNETLTVVSQQLVDNLKVDAVAIWTADQDTRFMHIEASIGLSSRFIRFFNKTDRIALGKGLVGSVMEKKQSLFINNLAEYQSVGTTRWNEMLKDEGIVSILAAPIFVHDEIIGAFNIYYKKEHTFTDAERLFFEVLANQIAVIISNDQQFRQLEASALMLKDQVENMTNIQQVTQILNHYLHESLDVSLSYVADYFTKKFNVKSIAVFKSDANSDKLPLIASHNISGRMLTYFHEHIPVSQEGTLLGGAYISKEPQISSRVFTDERISKDWVIAMANEHHVAMGAFPLIVQGRPIGVLATFYDHLHEFTDEELTILGTFAQFFAVALENASTFETLATERRKTKSMVDSIEDGLLVYNMDGCIIDANPRTLELFHLKYSDFVGKQVKEIASNANLSPILEISQLTLSAGETKELDFAEPYNKFLHVTEVPLKDEDGASMGSMRVLHDFTQERVVERLKSNFVATASHQLRTPLTGIKWGLLALSEEMGGDLNDVQKKLIKKIISANDNVINLINDILNVGKIEEGRFEYKFSRGSVTDIVDELLENFEVNIEKQGLTVVRDYPKQGLPVVLRDRDKLSLAIRNLLDNAIKYTQQNGIITVKAWGDKDFLRISVSDTGIGVPKKDLPFLFNKFYRAPNAVRLETDGSGLGLFFTKSIIDKHNGILTIESEEGKGATFTISLPISLEPTTE